MAKKKELLRIKAPRWIFLLRGKSLSQSWSPTLHMPIIYLPVKSFALGPWHTNGRSWEKAESGPRLCPRHLGKAEDGGPAATLAWTEANVSKVPSRYTDTSSNSSSPCCLQKLKQLRWEGLFMLHLSRSALSLAACQISFCQLKACQ